MEGLGDRVADLSADDEAVLLDAGDSGELLDVGRGEAFGVEGGDEWGVLEPEGQSSGEDLDFAGGVEGAELRRDGGGRRAEGLVEVLARRRVFGDHVLRFARHVGGYWESYVSSSGYRVGGEPVGCGLCEW